MEDLKQYTFIKPDILTVDQKYQIYLKYKDVCGYANTEEDEFYETYKDKDHIGSILTHYMIKYQTTPVDFTFIDAGKRIIEGIIVDNNVKYKKRGYISISPKHLKTGDNVLFIKKIAGWGFYILCTEIEDQPEEKSTLRYITH